MSLNRGDQSEEEGFNIKYELSFLIENCLENNSCLWEQTEVGQIIPEDNADYNLLLSSLVQTMLRMRILIE